MVAISTLWLPILLSAVLVFVASSVIHMMLGYHKNDYRPVPAQDDVQEALRRFAIPPGDYMLPRAADTKEMSSPGFVEKLEKGPVIVMTVMPNGPWNMGASLALWFVYSLVVSVFAAYVAGRALGPADHYLAVFRFAGVTALLGYSLALLQASIWYRRSWRTTLVSMFDGLVYALLTAGTFGWLWPR